MARRGLAPIEGMAGLALGVVSLLAASAGGSLVAAQAPAPVAAPSPPRQTPASGGPWAPPVGEAFEHDEAMRHHADDVADYTLRATLDPVAHTVHGEGTIVWRNTSHAPVRELWLHLYLNGFKNQRTLFLRAPAAGGRGTGPVDDWGYIDVKKLVARELDGVDLWPGADKTTPGDPDDQTDIRVPLPREIPAGGTLTLDATWEDKLPRVIERTGYFGSFHMVGQWFPKLARLEPDGRWAHFPFYHLTEFYSDFGTYDVTLDVPAGFRVGATGSRVSEATAGGRSVARYVQGDVHDFAWTAWDRFEERQATAEGVSIRCLYPPGFEAAAERELETVRVGLEKYGDWFGKYPYPVLTLVHPPPDAGEAGGMEYPTLITTGGSWWEPRGVHAIEAVTIHEFGHQYFYGLVATNEEAWPFLDEGLNTYAEGLALEAMYGEGSAVSLGGLTIGQPVVERAFALQLGHDDPVAQPAHAFATGSDYGALVYARTATIFRTLARVYGAAPTLRALGRYTRRYRFEHPGADELLGAVRDVLGDGAAQNLRIALFDRGWVDYTVASATSQQRVAPAGVFDRDGRRDTVAPGTAEQGTWEGWALVMRHGTLAFPVQIELASSDGSVETVPWDGVGDWVRIPYEGKSSLERVTVDPGATVYLDEDLLNGSYLAAGKPRAPRTLERGAYAGELLLQAVMP